MPVSLAVALGGVVGTLLRFAIGNAVVHDFSQLPRATLIVNLAGSVLLGFVLRWAGLSHEVAPTLRAAAAVGFCGAFTTMSTFSYELFRFGATRQWALAISYLLLTLVGTLLAVWAGYRLGAVLPA